MAPQGTSATNGQSSNGPASNDIQQVFKNFTDALTNDEISAASHQYEILGSSAQQKEEIFKMKRKDWEDAVKMHDEYTAIQEQISIKLGKATEEFVNNITDTNSEFGELGTHLDQSISCIKETQQKFLAVITAVNELENAIKNHCNNRDAEVLEDEIGLSSHLSVLKTCAVEACNEAGASFDEAVKAAGIKALLNLESMVTLANTLQANVQSFNEDVNTQLTATETGAAEKRDLLNTAIEELCKVNDDLATKGDQLNALDEFKSFTSTEPRRRPTTIDHLLLEAEKNFDLENNQ